jgi:surfactin family lipopeptide synthetase C
MENVEDFYPLSPMQEGMFFHSLYQSESGSYFRQPNCTVYGPIDIAQFERAWQHVVARHAILRTSFVWGELQKPVQVVQRRTELPLEQLDWREFTATEQEQRLRVYLQADIERGFDLSQAPLMRLAIIRLAEEQHHFIWSFHHLLLDGWSVSLVLKEVFAFYHAFSQGQTLRLGRSRPYRDYIVWLGRQNLSKAESFWRRTLAGYTAPTPLLGDKKEQGKPVPSGAYVVQQSSLSASSTGALQALAQQHKLTFNTLVQGAWALLLSRCSGSRDVAFGAVVSGRPADLPGADSIIGLFINTLLVRVQTEADARLLPWLKRIQAQQAEARQFEYSPLVQVQGWSEVARGLPLFESLVAFDNFPVDNSLQEQGKADQGLQIGNVGDYDGTSVPLVVAASPGPELQLRLGYDTSRFDADTIARLLEYLQSILESFALDPEQQLSDLQFLTSAERGQLLVGWNDTQTEFPQDLCINQLIEAQAERTPRNVAVTYQDEQLTYRQLNAKANQIARHLRSLGVGPESRVGICMGRSAERVVAILGVLKAGGAYVPLDPATPPERLSFMIADAGVEVLLTEQQLEARFASENTRVVSLDAEWESITGEPLKRGRVRRLYERMRTRLRDTLQESEANLDQNVSPDNLAYIIFTSGSTGQPKGVAVQHRGVINLLHQMAQAPGMTQTDRALLLTSISFDIAGIELFLPLCVGASIVVAPQAAVTDPRQLSALIAASGVTFMQATPSAYRMMLEGDPDTLRHPSLRVLVAAGEALSDELAARLKAEGRQLWNGYGPTETTIYSATELVESEPVTIGRPVANTQLYILDEGMQPVPQGVSGELFIGGVALARGYINRPDLTAEKFVPDPFGKVPGARLYRTGDLVRHLSDGKIDYQGRIDHQVKIRGFRIELEEIETVLAQHPCVRRAVVTAREQNGGDKQLVAYFTTRTQQEAPAGAELRRFLKDKLPDYMVPSAFVAMESIPLTGSGKVNRNALPAPDQSGSATDSITFVPPRDTLELQLTLIWEDVLGIGPVGITDNFFDLGGHSISAVRLMAQIQKQFGRDLQLAVLLQGATIEQLARVIREREDAPQWSPLVPIQPKGTKTPFFCVHPVGGQVLCYRHLARSLGQDQPFYGLQAPNLEEVETAPSIEEMAAQYLEEVRRVQPDGPYLLGGWSFGGVVAFEMARQLQKVGQEVSQVVILDTVSPAVFHKLSDYENDESFLLFVLGRARAREEGQDVLLSADDLKQLAPDERLGYFLNEMKKAGLAPKEVDLKLFRRFLNGYRSRQTALRSYKGERCELSLVFYRCEEQDADWLKMLEGVGWEPDDLTFGWKDLSTEAVETHLVPGHHERMCEPPQVEHLARLLAARFEETTTALVKSR